MVSRLSQGNEFFRPSVAWAPLVLVAGAMCLLVIAATSAEVRTTSLRRELTAAIQPASTLTDRLQYYLAREMAQLRALAATGDDRFHERYEEMRELEAESWPALMQLADALGPELVAHIRELEAGVRAWHLLVSAGTSSRPALPDEDATRRETQAYEAILGSFEALTTRVDALRHDRMQALADAENALRIWTLVLAVIATAAAVGATWSISQIQRLARETHRSREDIARFAEGRARLIRGLAHDLKNPLAAAAGYARLLEARSAHNHPSNAPLRIVSAITAATDIINDLIELSEAESGQLVLRPELASIEREIEDAVAQERGQFDSGGIHVEFTPAEGLPAVHVDRRRLRQILGNLLSNARKYTPRGGCVRVRAELRTEPAAPATGPWLAIDVTDTGIGIPPDRQRAIFDEFVRFETDGRQGSGLGLAISRRLAELMGGALTVRSEPGRGSTFTVWLPIPETGSLRRQ